MKSKINKEKNVFKFKIMYDITLTLCQLPSEVCKCSCCAKKMWADLAAIWYGHQKALGCEDIFYTVLHKIHWGVYPNDDYGDGILALLSMVEQEILADDYAYQAWSSTEPFKQALDEILSPLHGSRTRGELHYHSILFCQYLHCRTSNTVIHKGQNLDQQACCLRYEEVTKLLLPEASEWTIQQWSDDRVLLQALENRYGINYLGKGDDLSHLYSVLSRKWLCSDELAAKDIMGIKMLTPALAAVIWPTNAESSMVEAFLIAYRKRIRTQKPTRTRFSYDEIRSSGVFHLLNIWLNESVLRPDNRNAVLLPLYEISIDI